MGRSQVRVYRAGVSSIISVIWINSIMTVANGRIPPNHVYGIKKVKHLIASGRDMNIKIQTFFFC